MREKTDLKTLQIQFFTKTVVTPTHTRVLNFFLKYGWTKLPLYYAHDSMIL